MTTLDPSSLVFVVEGVFIPQSGMHAGGIGSVDEEMRQDGERGQNPRHIE